MATNTFAPSGFHPTRNLGGSPNYMVQTFQIVYNLATQIGYGDPVVQTSGYLAKYTVGGTSISGIFLGCEYFDPNQGKYQWFPAWTAPTNLSSTQIVTAKVLADPFMRLQVQSSGTAVTQASVGQNIDIVTGTSGAPNSLTGLSTCAVDAANIHTTATLPFKIVNIVKSPGINPSYSPTADNNWLEVTFNTNALLQTLGE